MLIICCCITFLNVFAQNKVNFNAIEPFESYENIHVKAVFENEYASYYLIWIKQHVKSHKHIEHAESITVISGSGLMTVGDKQFEINAGDFFVIPKDTFHSLEVTSDVPIKVLSVQMPKFNIEDRVFEEEK